MGLLTSRKLGRHFGVEGRGFQQRRRQDVADAGYRDVLVPVLETSALGHHRPVAFESDLCVIRGSLIAGAWPTFAPAKSAFPPSMAVRRAHRWLEASASPFKPRDFTNSAGFKG